MDVMEHLEYVFFVVDFFRDFRCDTWKLKTDIGFDLSKLTYDCLIFFNIKLLERTNVNLKLIGAHNAGNDVQQNMRHNYFEDDVWR